MRGNGNTFIVRNPFSVRDRMPRIKALRRRTPRPERGVFGIEHAYDKETDANEKKEKKKRCNNRTAQSLLLFVALFILFLLVMFEAVLHRIKFFCPHPPAADTLLLLFCLYYTVLYYLSHCVRGDTTLSPPMFSSPERGLFRLHPKAFSLFCTCKNIIYVDFLRITLLWRYCEHCHECSVGGPLLHQFICRCFLFIFRNGNQQCGI